MRRPGHVGHRRRGHDHQVGQSQQQRRTRDHRPSRHRDHRDRPSRPPRRRPLTPPVQRGDALGDVGAARGQVEHQRHPQLQCHPCGLRQSLAVLSGKGPPATVRCRPGPDDERRPSSVGKLDPHRAVEAGTRHGGPMGPGSRANPTIYKKLLAQTSVDALEFPSTPLYVGREFEHRVPRGMEPAQANGRSVPKGDGGGGRMARIVGLDIGTSAIRAVESTVGEGGRPVLEAFGQVGLRPGTVVDGEVRDRTRVVEARTVCGTRVALARSGSIWGWPACGRSPARSTCRPYHPMSSTMRSGSRQTRSSRSRWSERPSRRR